MFEKRIENLTVGDIKLIKLSTFAFAFFIAGFCINFVLKYRWVWLVLGILFAIKPSIKLCKCKCKNSEPEKNNQNKKSRRKK